MNKTVFSVFASILFVVQRALPFPVEVSMELDTEMPCLKSEMLEGTLRIINKGEEGIKLLKGTPNFPDMLVHEQLYLYPDISPQKEKRILAGEGSMGGKPSRQSIKEQTDSELADSENVFILKPGENCVIKFWSREITAALLAFTHERIPFKAELYLSPDVWVPVGVRPSISVACDAKITPIRQEGGTDTVRHPMWIFRTRIDQNEFLCATENFSSRRVLDITSNDTVTISGQTVTMKSKNGLQHIFSTKEISGMIDKHKQDQKMRKNDIKDETKPREAIEEAGR
jgi:hypothetical protein